VKDYLPPHFAAAMGGGAPACGDAPAPPIRSSFKFFRYYFVISAYAHIPACDKRSPEGHKLALEDHNICVTFILGRVAVRR
jgi:hypothetical protein